uniref:FCH domain-containing protein n=1 Tax=Periophthalmus magnuspinnatus TaxID=409849 RepID=A0A3B4BHM7_9GOBI
MTSHVKLRKDKVGILDYDTQIKEVRCQLIDQLKVLDLQLEQKSQQLQDLTDYLRRRGEIESEYARSLDKLAERFTSRIKRNKYIVFQLCHRKDPGNHSVSNSWVALLSQTRQESKDHNLLSETCSTFIVQPLSHCQEYTQRLAKKSRDICTSLQDGLLKVTTEMQTVSCRGEVERGRETGGEQGQSRRPDWCHRPEGWSSLCLRRGTGGCVPVTGELHSSTFQ